MIDKPGKAVTRVTKKSEKHITPTNIRHCIATVGNDHLTDVKRRVIAKGIGHSMDVHDKVYTDKTLKNIEASMKPKENCITEENPKQFKKLYKYLNALMYFA